MREVSCSKRILKELFLAVFCFTYFGGISQTVENINTLILPKKQALNLDYISDGSGSSIILGYFFLDIDTDKDGIVDFNEIGDNDDLDGDGIPNISDPDDDNDGIIDVLDKVEIGTISMPPSYYKNGINAANAGLHPNDFWQFVPNKRITTGNYAGNYEHPGAHLYVDNNANEIPDVLEYSIGNNKIPPYVTDKNVACEHLISGPTLGLLDEWNYSGSPGITNAQRNHVTGRTIFYIADDDSSPTQIPSYHNFSPYGTQYSDIYNTINSQVDYDIYGTNDENSSNIPAPTLKKDLEGISHWKYRYFEDIIDGEREIVFFEIAFFEVPVPSANTYYSKTEFNLDLAVDFPAKNANTSGDDFGDWVGQDNWFPKFQYMKDHDKLAAGVFGVGTKWIDIANAPINGSSPIAIDPLNQNWVDQYENWRPDRKIIQYISMDDWLAATAIGAGDVIFNRYGYDFRSTGRNIIVRSVKGKAVHFLIHPVENSDGDYLIGVEDEFGGGNRDLDNYIFYFTTFKQASLSLDQRTITTLEPCGDSLQYEIVIRNYGRTKAEDLVFDEVLSSATPLINGSVETNLGSILEGNLLNDQNIKISIPELEIGDSVVVIFTVQLNSPLLFNMDTIKNQGTLLGSNFATLESSDPNAELYFQPTATDVSKILDKIPPTFSCLNDTVIYLSNNCQLEITDFTTLITASDNCNGTVVLSQFPISGTIISDTSEVTIYASDQFGNIDSCSFSIFAVDTIKPTLTCANVIQRFTNEACFSNLGDLSALVIASDNCTSFKLFQSIDSTAKIYRDTTVLITATDLSGNKSSCLQNIQLIDTIAPKFTCSNPPIHYLNNSCFFEVDKLDSFLTLPSDCDANFSIDQSIIEGTLIDTSTWINLTVYDVAGNSNTCSIFVEIADSTSPIVICPDSLVLYAQTSCISLIPALDTFVQIQDNCDNWLFNQSISEGTNLTADTTILILVTDKVGNSSSCQLTAFLIDTISPKITCIDTLRLISDENCSAIFPDLNSSITIDNDCGNFLQFQSSIEKDSMLFSESTVYISTNDESGNQATCSIQIQLIDTTPPSITCPIDTNLYLGTTCSFIVPDFRLEIQFIDNCNSTITFDQTPSYNSILDDTTIITITAFDNELTSTCTFKVNPIDTTSPSFLHQDTIVICSQTMQIPLPIATDVCGFPIVEQITGPTNGTPILPGIYSMSYLAKDQYNNTDTIELIIQVFKEPLFEVEFIQPTCFYSKNGQISISSKDANYPIQVNWKTGESTPTLTNLSNGEYFATVIDGNNCFIDTIFTISTPDSLLLNETITPISCHSESDAMLEISPSGGTGSIAVLWENGETTNSRSSLSDAIYKVTITDDSSCFFTKEFDIIRPDSIQIQTILSDFQGYQVSDDGACDGIVQLNISGGTLPYFIQWPFEVDAAQLCEGIYEIEVFDFHDCQQLVEFEITALKKVVIPNAFSPNNDGINDLFVIQYLDLYDSPELIIYNRWGEKVYEAKSYENNWDGTSTTSLTGTQVVNGSYFYVLKLSNQVYKGSIVLKR